MFRSHGVRPVLALAALAGLLVLLATRRHGVNVSPDSAAYLAAAEGIAGGQGVLGVDGRAMSLYAPGLPALLALPAGWGGAEEVARWANAGVLVVLLVLVGTWLTRVVRPPVAVAATGLLAVSAPLVDVHTWLWSEPVFVLLSVLYLGVLLRIARTPGRVTGLVVLAGVLAAGAVLVRYSGVSMLPIAAVVLLTRAVPPRRRLADSVAFGAAFAVPVGAWLARNVVSTGAVTGERAANAAGPWAIARKGLHTVAGWFVPGELPDPLQTGLVVALAAAAAALAVVVVRHRPGRADVRWTVLAVTGAHLVLTFATMVALTARTNVDPLGDRLLAPLVVPLLVLLAVAVDVAADALPRRRAVALGGAALVALGTASVVVVGAQVAEGGRGPLSYNSTHWQDGDVRVLLAHVPERATTISNQARGVRYLRGAPVSDSPRTRLYASETPAVDDLPALRERLADGPVHLVWIGHPRRAGYHRSPDDLAGRFRLEELARTPAGVVYRVSAPSRPMLQR